MQSVTGEVDRPINYLGPIHMFPLDAWERTCRRSFSLLPSTTCLVNVHSQLLLFIFPLSSLFDPREGRQNDGPDGLHLLDKLVATSNLLQSPKSMSSSYYLHIRKTGTPRG